MKTALFPHSPALLRGAMCALLVGALSSVHAEPAAAKADTKEAAAVPKFSLKTLYVSVPVDPATGKGPLPSPTNGGRTDVAYSKIQGAYFGSPEAGCLSLPGDVSNVAALLPTLTNPYATLALSLKLDKLADNEGRLLVVTQESAKTLAETLRDPEFVFRTKELFANVEGVRMILAMENEGRIFIFFTLLPVDDSNRKMVYVRTFSKEGDRYLIATNPIREPLVLNIFSALFKTPDKLIVRDTPPTD